MQLLLKITTVPTVIAVWLLLGWMRCLGANASPDPSPSPALLATGEIPAGKITSPIPPEWLKALVSIEIVDDAGKARPIGTGFLVQTKTNHIALVTAKHVVIAKDGKSVIPNLAYRLNNRTHSSDLIRASQLDPRLGSWFLSDTFDVACRLIYSIKDRSDILTIPLDLLLREKYLQPGASVVTMGFPMGLRSDSQATPIVRRGLVGRSDADNIILDAFVFPGNSGGPVIYFPVFQLDEKVFSSPFLNQPRVVGVVSSYISYTDVAVSRQTERPRITFEENSGLANVVPADALIAIMEQADFVALDSALPPETP